MPNPSGSNEKLSSKVEIDYPDFSKLPPTYKTNSRN